MTLDPTLAVTVEDDVTFAFRVRNEGDDPVELTFPTSQLADVAVYADDEPVWRWSDGRMFTQALVHETIQPGGTFEREYRWTEATSGDYTAVATLEARTGVEARAEFSV